MINACANSTHPGLTRRTEGVHKLEEIGEIHDAVAVEVILGVAAAEGIHEIEKVGEIHDAVAVEIGRDLSLWYRCFAAPAACREGQPEWIVQSIGSGDQVFDIGAVQVRTLNLVGGRGRSSTFCPPDMIQRPVRAGLYPIRG